MKGKIILYKRKSCCPSYFSPIPSVHSKAAKLSKLLVQLKVLCQLINILATFLKNISECRKSLCRQYLTKALQNCFISKIFRNSFYSASSVHTNNFDR